MVGWLDFSANYHDEIVTDRYKVKITIPTNFPQNTPSIWEINNKIPDDYHLNGDNSLCLGTPHDIFFRLKKNPSILYYVEGLVIPYLYRYSYSQKYRKNPFPDYSHGIPGLIEYYFDYFSTDTISCVLDLLLLSMNNFSDKSECPCDSSKSIKECHKKQIFELRQLPRAQIYEDYKNISSYLNQLMNSIRRK